MMGKEPYPDKAWGYEWPKYDTNGDGTVSKEELINRFTDQQ
jgi:hypothetical protein